MSKQNIITEPCREIPVTASYDVIVGGGGPAGIAAALGAVRSGARTLLIETHGCLGGVWTAGVLSWVIDAGNKEGIMCELISRLDAVGARAAKGNKFAYDVESMKVILEEMCGEAGVSIRLHTRVVSVVKDGRRLTHLLTESRSGREAFQGKVFIDTTGDGELADLAGCAYDYGHPHSGEAQPMSLVGLVTGVRGSEIGPFVGKGVPKAKEALFNEFRRAGVIPSYAAPTLFPVREDFFALMANHEYGVSPASAEDITRATIRARKEIFHLVRALRALGGAWMDLRLVATGAQIGIREGRRIHGLYRVSMEDMLAGRQHEDGVCRVTSGIDVHSVDPVLSKTYGEENGIQCKPYDIPLRAMIAVDVDGLMMAGRCISGDFWSHSSYRMTGNAVAMGEAAGMCAAVAARRKVLPQECDWLEIKALSAPQLRVAST